MRLDAHFDMLPERAFEKRGFGSAPATLEGGKGGGGGGPTQSTAYQTNLPEYAKPYVMNMLGAAQNQLFTTSPGTDGQPGEITGFKPYTPYSTDPTNYFAGPSSLQRQVYGEAGQMQTPGQFGQATGLAGTAGMGQLGTAQQAGIYGGLGTALGAAGAMQAMPAFSAGQQFASQVTDPRSMAQYMSPYQQAVTDVAKNAAIREAQLAQQATNLGAARQGTYGGARQALMQGERERNLLSNLSNIQAQGSQAAFDKAMQTQQFGANLGLQGIQTGLQGVQAGMQGIGQGLQGVGAQQAGFAGAGQAASTLGQLGGAQQQADLARMGFQQQTGQQQQAYQQNIINQAIQDYATAQQYPYMQLSTMSNLLRGLPMQSMSTQQYQAQPSTTQQLLGLAGTGASLYGAFGRKEGGTIKEYAAGGGVRASLENKIDDIAETGGAKGLQGLLAQTKSPQAKQMIIDRMREEGITAAPSGLGRNMAGGGIIAFADGDLVEDPLAAFSGVTPESMAADQLRIDEEKRKKAVKQYNFLKDASPVAAARMLADDPSLEPKAAPATTPAAAPVAKKEDAAPAAAPANAATEYNSPTGLAAVLAERRKLLGIDGPGEKSEAFMKAIEERQAGMGKEREADRYLRMAESFAKFGSTAGPIGKAASEALGGFAKGEAAARKEEDKMKLEGMKMQADLEKARRAEERGDLDAAEKFYTSAEDRKVKLIAAEKSGTGAATKFEQEAITKVMEANPGMSFLEALQSVRGAGRAESTTLQNQKAVLASLDAQILTAKKDEKPALMRKRDEIYNQMLRTSSGSGAPGKVIDFNAIK
jgi:hypothetical protein